MLFIIVVVVVVVMVVVMVVRGSRDNLLVKAPDS